MLLKQGASVDLPSSLGGTALMDAAAYGHLSIVLVLLQHSASIDLQTTNGGTALMIAAVPGHEACVQALLQAKANTELLDDRPRQHVGRVHLRARGHHGVAPHQGHLAEDGCHAGEQGALPEPHGAQHDPRLHRGRSSALGSLGASRARL